MADSVLARIMRNVMRRRMSEAGIDETPNDLFGALDAAWEMSRREDNRHHVVVVAEMTGMRASNFGRIRDHIYYIYIHRGRADFSCMPGLRAAYRDGVRIDHAVEHYLPNISLTGGVHKN